MILRANLKSVYLFNCITIARYFVINRILFKPESICHMPSPSSKNSISWSELSMRISSSASIVSVEPIYKRVLFMNWSPSSSVRTSHEMIRYSSSAMSTWNMYFVGNRFLMSFNAGNIIQKLYWKNAWPVVLPESFQSASMAFYTQCAQWFLNPYQLRSWRTCCPLCLVWSFLLDLS